MTIDKSSRLVPNLRFPQFRDTPGWPKKPLGKFLTPIVREREKPAVPYTGLGIRSHGRGTFRKELEQPDKTSMERLYEVDCNDLIVNITFAWEGAIAIVRPEDSGALVSHRFPTYQFNQKAVLPKFFQYPMLDKQLIYNLGVISPGGAGRNRVLSKADFLKIEVAIPEVAEQQKIADCLGSLDDLIAAEGRKLEALRQHKLGLMQQLFPQPGETVPRLRFPEFENAPEWSARAFARLYDFKPTNTYSRDQLNYDAGVVRNIHYGDIHKKFQVQFCVTHESVPFVNSTEMPDRINPEALCKEGDMVFADASEDLADVGKSIELVDLANEQVLSGTHTILARPRDSTLALGFGAYLFKSRSTRAQIEKEAQGTKVMAISPSRLSGITLHFPSDHEEQLRIVACLSALDASLAAQVEKLKALKTYKQGLLQQLFPGPEEGSR
jgi:type I restriction enzyme S subunit